MKEKLSLIDICKLPDVQLHSKKALFKAIVAKEALQTQEMKDHIIRLSYTVKTIGVQGQEVGISSKRVPLKLKKKQQYKTPSYQTKDNFLPHQSFYSQALIPVRKQKQKQAEDHNPLQISTARNTIHIVEDPHYETQQFKVRSSKSMSQMRTARYQRDQQENIEEFGRIKGLKRVSSALKKKSYSGMLKECTAKKDATESINPINHEENPLFKTIKKIKQIYPTICDSPRPIVSRHHKSKSRNSVSSNMLRHYRQQLI